MKKKNKKRSDKPKCGLCGKSEKLIKTDCCDQWICDDNGEYVIFSYAHNSCWRNHNRYTICSHHYQNNHSGKWQECSKCRKSFDTEDYVYLATNEYNFEKLKNPPSFKPTRCAECGNIIDRAKEGYTIVPNKGFVCSVCKPSFF